MENGIRGLCPRCRRVSVFKGYLDIVPTCLSCGLSFGGHDVGDAAVFAGIFLIGFLAVGLAILLEFTVKPPLWLHMTLWPAAILGGTLGLLRPLKGIAVALQYRYRSVEEASRPGGR